MNSLPNEDLAFKYRGYSLDDVMTVVDFSQSLERLKFAGGEYNYLKSNLETDFCLDKTLSLNLNDLKDSIEHLNKYLRKVGLESDIVEVYEDSRIEAIASISIKGINRRQYSAELNLNACE